MKSAARNGIAVATLAMIAAACQRIPADRPARVDAAIETSSAAAAILGRDVSALLPTHFARGARSKAAHATLVRFWTDACPYCERSLPALEELRREYASEGLDVIGVYHPKPPCAVDDARVTAAAERIGYHGAISVDPEWKSLHAIWLDTGDRAATSASFVLDARGRIRFVHPGPEFQRTDDPAFASDDRDYRAIDAAIRTVLAEAHDAR